VEVEKLHIADFHFLSSINIKRGGENSNSVEWSWNKQAEAYWWFISYA